MANDVAPPAPSVSVILPNYNHAAHIGRAIRCMLTQTRLPDEVIVIDDGSDDGSLEVIAAAAAGEPRVRVLENGTNIGVPRTLDRGLREARSSHVLFGAADDFYAPRLIEASVDALARHPGAGLSCANSAIVEPGTGRRTTMTMPFGEREACLAPDELVARLRRRNFLFSSGTVVMRREAAVAAGGLRAALAWHCDWFLNFVVAFREGICFIPEELSTVTLAPASYSANRSDPAAERQVLMALIARIATPEYHDVFDRFRRAAVLPEYDPGLLAPLLRSGLPRRYLSALLIYRLLSYKPLAYIGNRLPATAKESLRRLVRI